MLASWRRCVILGLPKLGDRSVSEDNDPEPETRKYTLDEANALLPRVRDVVQQLRDIWLAAAGERTAYERAQAAHMHAVDVSVAHQRLLSALWDIQPLAGWLRSHDIVLRQPDIGLIDFLTDIDGRDAYLCWKLGEDRITHWHGTDEGFDARKPLPDA